MHVCAYVCEVTSVFAPVCQCVSVYVCVCVCLFCVCLHVSVCVIIRVFVCVCVCGMCVRVCEWYVRVSVSVHGARRWPSLLAARGPGSL